jgi:basic membrane protein A
MEDLTGKQFGHYQIVAPLGEGGMAAVYKAYQPSMERHVAIKVLPRHMAASEEFLNRFRREAKLLAQLQHPNILPVFDYGESDGYPYIVMPFVPSGTLADLIKDQHLPLHKVRRIMTQIGDALAYAHAHGMIHRDIKPSNVLIDESGNCLLTDFGLARMVESSSKLTSSGTVLGTPAYMSPEQGAGSEIDHRSDIYSLGIILYEMVTGRVPYNAETPIAIVFKHIQDPLPSAKKLNPDLPESVELILLKALAKSPEDRYQSMEEFLRAIQAATPETPSKDTPIEQKPTIIQQPEKTKVVSPVRSADVQKSGTGIIKYAIIGLILLALVAGGIWGLPRLASPKENTPKPEPAVPATEIPPTKAIIQNPTQAGPAQMPPSERDCIKAEVFCVGLVTDVGKINDRSFNQSAWEGVQLAEKEFGAFVRYIETTDSRDYVKNIATFGDAGYDVIVTVGFAMNEATTIAADQYPDVKFIGVDQFQSPERPGVVGLNFPEDQAGFLVGALAAMMSESHKIGAVCGTDLVPPVWRFGEGYRAGAAYADSIRGTITNVFVVYHSDVGFDKTFTDPEWGAVTAKSMMDQGVDVVFGCGGITGNGAITAAAQAGKYAIGVDTDQYYTLPEAAPRMLSSAMKLITPGVFNLIRQARENIFPAGNFHGAAGYAPFHDLDGEVPPDVKSEMDKINAGLLNGSIQTGVPISKP